MFRLPDPSQASANPAIKRPHRRWSDDCKAKLHELYPTRTMVAEIARLVDRSVRAVWAKARSLGLRRPRSVAPKSVPDKSPAVLQSALDFEALVRRSSPKMFVRTALGGNRTKWFGEVPERMERLWLASVDANTISAVFDHTITAKAIWRKAKRINLPNRHGANLIKDLATALAIDAERAPLPSIIRVCGKTLKRRQSNLSGEWFWSAGNRTSDEVKESKFYQSQMGQSEASIAMAF